MHRITVEERNVFLFNEYNKPGEFLSYIIYQRLHWPNKTPENYVKTVYIIYCEGEFTSLQRAKHVL